MTRVRAIGAGADSSPTGASVSGHRGLRQGAALAIALAFIGASVGFARLVDVHLGDAAPLLGHLHPRVGLLILPALAVAATGVCTATRLAERLPFRWLLAATWLTALCWAVALAGADGADGILRPLTTTDEYLPDLAHVHGLGSYLTGFIAHINPPPGQFAWSVHDSGGPPGTLLIFTVLAKIGLSGRLWASMLVIVVGCSAAPAAALGARYLDGEDTARRVAPFLAFAPAAIWVATSADALFLGLSAWGIALLAAAASHTGTRSDARALLAGLLLAAALYCSYGIAPLGAAAIAAVVAKRRIRPLLVGTVSIAVVAALFAAFGFWWWTGLSATRIRYGAGIASMRPYSYFLIADLAAFAIAIGPAAIAGIASLPRRSPLWWAVGGALLAAAVSDLSGLSKGEVERIWLPFTPWVLIASSSLGNPRSRRTWLGAQLALGLTLQIVLADNW